MILSIIIPVFNAAQFLNSCLTSALNQNLDLTQFEIIIINDGSTDNSDEIIERFKSNHTNIVSISQVNSGVSVSRNKGLDAAKGKYILFLDADDYLEDDGLKKLLLTAENRDLDLLYFIINRVNQADQKIAEYKVDNPNSLILNGWDHPRGGFIPALYKRSTLGNLRFTKGIYIAEDALFNLQFHVLANRVSFIELPVYNYREHNTSAVGNVTKNLTLKVFNSHLLYCQTLNQFIEKNKRIIPSDKIKYFDRPFYLVIKMAFESNVLPILDNRRRKVLLNQLEQLNRPNVNRLLKQDLPLLFCSDLKFFMYMIKRKIIGVLKYERN